MIHRDRQPLRISRPLITLLVAGVLLSCNSLAQDTAGRGRIAPPPAISCDRNQLTSWTGKVSGYRRGDKVIWIEISTDEQTVEQATIEHDGWADAASRYLLWGDPFTHADWTAIESSPGKLMDGMRATVWICSDGMTPPVIDWQPDRN